MSDSDNEKKHWLIEDPDIRIDVESLEEYMLARFKEDPAGLIPYEALAHVIAKPVPEGRGGYCLKKARRVMRDKHKMLILCKRGAGVYWPKNNGVNDHLGGRIKRSRNQARNLIRESGTFKFEGATLEQKARFLASQNLAGAIIAFSDRKAVDKANDAMRIDPTRLNTERMLDMFKTKE